MIVYGILMCITVFVGWIATRTKKAVIREQSRNNWLAYILMVGMTALPCALVSGLRDFHVGTDTSGTYYTIYLQLLSGKMSSVRDVGYAFINWLAIQLSSSYTSVLLVTAFLITGLTMIAIFKSSSNPVMSLLLFFTTNMYFISMNAIRQSIATSIFILAIPYIRDRKPKRYFFMIFLAATVHIIAVVYIPVYFLVKVKLNPRRIILLGGIVVVFGNLLGILANFLLTKVTFFSTYFSWYLFTAYNSKETNWFSLLVEIGIMALLLIVYKQAKNDEEYRIFFWLHFIATGLLVLSSRIPQGQRMSWLFSFSTVVYLPKVLSYIKGYDNRKIISFTVNAAFFAYMFITVFMRGYHEVVPYSSILFSDV